MDHERTSPHRLLALAPSQPHPLPHLPQVVHVSLALNNRELVLEMNRTTKLRDRHTEASLHLLTLMSKQAKRASVRRWPGQLKPRDASRVQPDLSPDHMHLVSPLPSPLPELFVHLRPRLSQLPAPVLHCCRLHAPQLRVYARSCALIAARLSPRRPTPDPSRPFCRDQVAQQAGAASARHADADARQVQAHGLRLRHLQQGVRRERSRATPHQGRH